MEHSVKYTGYTQDQIDNLKVGGIEMVAREMIRVREELDEATKIKSNLEKCYKTMRTILPEIMEEKGIDKISVDGRNITTRIELFASIPKDQREDAYDWLKNNDLGDLITNTVNAMTLKGTIKELLEKGENIPEDLFKITTVEMARFY